MFLKESEGVGILALVRTVFFPLFRRKVLAVVILVCVVMVCKTVFLLGGAFLSVYYGAKLHRNHRIQGMEQVAYYLLHNTLEIPFNAIKGLLASDPKTFIIDIKHIHYQKLAFTRDMAFVSTSGIIPEMPYVPAKLTLDGGMTP
jgi:hypothetical protein